MAADFLGYQGQRVVVCGAATGMGAAATRALVELGAEVHALDVADIDAPVKQSIRCDLRDPASIRKLRRMFCATRRCNQIRTP